MAAASDPSPSATPQAAPPPSGPAPIPLPPTESGLPPLSEDEMARLKSGLDGSLLMLVLLLAFLLGSFAVRNSDFWMHLATGRLLAQGQYTFGVDPFAFSTAGVYWANHAWLFDLLLYGAYQLLGGPGLVLLKALVVVALAWFLLLIRRPGQSLWIPATCVGLALLAVYPQLEMRPPLLSFVFLGITLYLLQKPVAPAAEEAGCPLRHLWLLPVLFALWVNLDPWFFLGPVTVGLFLLGEILQETLAPVRVGPDAPVPAERRTLGLVLLVGLAACLLSPHHVYAFTLPVEISFTASAQMVAQDPRFRWFFLSPFQAAYFERQIGWSVSGMTFFPLAAVSLVSFLVNLREVRWWRVCVWVPFFLLAAYRWQAIGFFAVVAGPIAALNFQDCASRMVRRFSPSPGQQAGTTTFHVPGFSWKTMSQLIFCLIFLILASGVLLWAKVDRVNGPWVLEVLEIPDPPVTSLLFLLTVTTILGAFLVFLIANRYDIVSSWSLGGRCLTILALLGLVVAAWPGWLFRHPTNPEHARRVAWDVEPDPSLKQVAETLQAWRQEGKLPADARGFHMVPQVANYCAWFGPAEKGLFDTRYHLFGGVAESYLDACSTLNMAEAGNLFEASLRGESVAKEEIDRIQDKVRGGLNRLQRYFRGQGFSHLVFHSRDLRQMPTSFQYLLSDTDQWTLIYLDGRTTVLAWKDPEKSETDHPLAALRWDPNRALFTPARPGAEPPREPKPTSWFGQYLVAAAQRDLAADEALVHLAYFQALQPRWAANNQTLLTAGLEASLVGAAGPALGHVAGPTLLGYHLCLTDAMLWTGLKDPEKVPPKVFRYADVVAQRIVQEQDAGPPAAALLAVRAARQAVTANPDDAEAYFRLFQAYTLLGVATRERAWAPRLPLLQRFRQMQRLVAMQHLVQLAETQSPFHRQLKELYEEMGYVDLAVKHLNEHVRLEKEAGPRPQEKPNEYKARVEQLDKEAKEGQTLLTKQRNLYEVQSARAQVYERARLARGLGLAEQALKVLMESRADIFKEPGAQLQMELMLTTGRLREARDLLTPVESDDPNKAYDPRLYLGTVQVVPGRPAAGYTWFRLLLAAATGDYADADQQLQDLLLPEQKRRADEVASLAQLVLSRAPRGPFAPPLAFQAQERCTQDLTLVTRSNQLLSGLAYTTDLMVLRGLLALEAGKPDQATQHFQEALRDAAPPDRYVPVLSMLGERSPLGAAALIAATQRGRGGLVFETGATATAARFLELKNSRKE